MLELTRETFVSEVEEADGVAVLDFWAPWCAPCRALMPILEDLAEEYRGRVRFLKLNVDLDPERAVAWGVRGVPTIVFLKGGRPVDQIVGIEPAVAFRRRIDALLAGGEPAA